MRDTRHSSLCALACALLVGLAPAPAAASNLSQKIAAARAQYLAQEYEQVIRLLTPVVQSPIATISEKVDAFELLGLSFLILGERDRARVAFENLLGLDPGHVLRDPTGSPKLKRFFEAAKESFVPGYKAHALVSLEHAAPSEAVAGRTAEFAARVVQGEAAVQTTVLRWRRAGLLTYRTVFLRGGGRRLGRFILPPDAADYTLEYYVEARDKGGNTVARVGSPERPLSLSVKGTGAPPPPVYKRWWFWTLIGAAVAGGITTGVLALTAEKAPEGNLPPGQVRLP
jgi:uncharacterized membrane protein YecN with MAPEG domain